MGAGCGVEGRSVGGVGSGAAMGCHDASPHAGHDVAASGAVAWQTVQSFTVAISKIVTTVEP